MYLDWHHSGARMTVTPWVMMQFTGKPTPEELDVATKKVELALDAIEHVFLGGTLKFQFIGNQKQLTIADLRYLFVNIKISCVSELISTFIFNFDFAKWPNVCALIMRLFELP
jgi:hypothetical protein